MKAPLKRLLIFGDGYGVPELLEYLPQGRVKGVIAASNRSQYHCKLRNIAENLSVAFLVQPPLKEGDSYARFIRDVKDLAPDGLLCHSYSMLINPEVLKIVEGRAFNVHASLLPRNRGPNPVQWALIRGESLTGVTLHLMDEGFDTGAIIDQEAVQIMDEDTWGSLMKRVRTATQMLLRRAIPQLLEGKWDARPQNEEDATVNKRIPRDSFRIDFNGMTDREIFNLVRAQVEPLAGAYIETGGEKIRFRKYLSMDEVASLRARYAQG